MRFRNRIQLRLPKGMMRAEALPAIRRADARSQQFIGLSEADALALADQLGQQVQVVPTQRDLDDVAPQPGRLTLVVRDGKIVRAQPL